jgi:hypothetical protein
MRRPRSLRLLSWLSASVILCWSIAPTLAQTTVCNKKLPGMGCKSQTAFWYYTGAPTVICTIDTVVEIVSSATCQGQSAGPATLLRCGAFSTPFSYSGGGFTHTFGTTSNWENVLNGACADFTYSAIAD